jgi:hypothetical protein
MMTQASKHADSWQVLAQETQREVDRITHLRNLLDLKDLAKKAEQCDRKALLAKRAELRNTFMEFAEQYRVLARKVKGSQEHGSSAKLTRAVCIEVSFLTAEEPLCDTSQKTSMRST